MGSGDAIRCALSMTVRVYQTWKGMKYMVASSSNSCCEAVVSIREVSCDTVVSATSCIPSDSLDVSSL